MSNEAHEAPERPAARTIDLIQRGTDRFHDQQAEARRLARAEAIATR